MTQDTTIHSSNTSLRNDIGFDMNDTVSAKDTAWIEACTAAAQKDDVYSVFRTTKAFQQIVEGTPKTGGIWLLRQLVKNPKFIYALPLIQTSDTVGHPLKMIDFSVSQSSGASTDYSLSPTTIRYANNAMNCLSLFGDNILDEQIEIHEIGGGYGGEAKIFNDVALSLFGSPIAKRWHTYDLVSSRGIIQRFLTDFSYPISFEDLGSQQTQIGKNSLVISNGAFSEMTSSLIDAYFDSVIAPAKFGYFITNFESQSAPFGGWTTQDFVDRLHKSGKIDVKILPTTEYLSYFDYQAGSKLVVFGQKFIRTSKITNKEVVKIRLISLLTEKLSNYIRSFIGTS